MSVNNQKRQRLSHAITIIDDSSDFESSTTPPLAKISPTCFLCGISFQTFSSDERESHLNVCLKSLEKDSSREDGKVPQSSGLRSENYSCIICDLNLSKRCLSARCQHLKRCAKQYGVGVRDLLQMIAPDKYEEIILTQQNTAEDIHSSTEISGSQIIDLCSESARPAEEASKPQKPNFMSVLMANAKSMWGSVASSSAAASTSTSSNAQTKTGGGVYSKRKVSSVSGIVSSSGVVDDDGAGALPRYTPDFKKVIMPPMKVPVIVDGFSYASPGLSDCYFLTHFHSDHYTGLDRSFESGRYQQYHISKT